MNTKTPYFFALQPILGIKRNPQPVLRKYIICPSFWSSLGESFVVAQKFEEHF
jgi:hypothetical protein